MIHWSKQNPVIIAITGFFLAEDTGLEPAGLLHLT